jgi:putative transposase
MNKYQKERIYPNKLAKQFLNQVMGNTRVMYNQLLAKCISLYKEYEVDTVNNIKPNLSQIGLTYLIKDIKNNPEMPWLMDTPHNCYVPVADHLSNAFAGFFRNLKAGKPGGYPKFKPRTHSGSVTFNKGRYDIVNIEDRHYLKLEGLWNPRKPGDKMSPVLIRINNHRDLPVNCKSIVIKRSPSGKYHVSILHECDYVEDSPRYKTLGIDLGLSTYLVAYDGVNHIKIENPKHLKTHERRLKRYQRAYSRKAKGSCNQNKARIKVAKQHERVSNTRDYFIKTTVHQLMKDVSDVVLEDLSIKSMMKNHKLAKSIGDASWYKFKMGILSYVNQRPNVDVFEVDTRYPSTQICSCCGTKSATKIVLGKSKWTCFNCGSHHDRDENASQNIYNAIYLNEGNIKRINPIVTIVATKVAKANAKKIKTSSATAVLQ